MVPQIRIAQDEAADEVLSNDPFALLVGMLLDQQYPMEHAFRGPWKILDRFGTLAPDAIAAAEAEAFADLCATPPAIHRYGRSMAGRVQQLATVVRDQYDGRAETIWTEAKDARDLLDRLKALPGFGDQKARIFAALVGKQLDVRPAGWQEAIGPYAEDGSYRSVADVVDPVSLTKVREFKQAAKAAAKAKAATVAKKSPWVSPSSHPSVPPAGRRRPTRPWPRSPGRAGQRTGASPGPATAAAVSTCAASKASSTPPGGEPAGRATWCLLVVSRPWNRRRVAICAQQVRDDGDEGDGGAGRPRVRRRAAEGDAAAYPACGRSRSGEPARSRRAGTGPRSRPARPGGSAGRTAAG
jgi:uncharacterized HhH-GPD family protein